MKKSISVFLAVILAFSMIGSCAPYIFAEPAETVKAGAAPAAIFEQEAAAIPAVKADGAEETEEEGSASDELFAGYVDSVFRSYSENPDFTEIVPEPTRDSGSDLLPAGSLELKVYNALLPYLKQVAAGERGSTDFYLTLDELGVQEYYTAKDLGLSSITDSSGNIPDSSWAALTAATGTDIHLLLNVLLNTIPYELYWFDKTSGFGGGFTGYYSYTSDYNGQEAFSLNGDYEYYFVVAQEYRDTDADEPYYTVDTAIGLSIQNSAKKAASIVKANKSKRDADKLTAYRDAICALTEYNWEAAYGGSTPYGNPWQLIWVFDEDESTNVVCEGYSKAFQYLFDMSTFYGNVSCRLVTGNMDGGGHMWNVVTMPDGRNYLMDVTNSDNGDTGSDILFFKGGTGSVAEGYSIPYYDSSIEYTYYDSIIELYGEDRLSLYKSDYKETPVITSCKLELTGKIGIRIYFRAPDNAKTAKIFFEDVETHTYPSTAEVTLDLKKSGNANYSSKQDLFIITFPEITSRELTRRIKFAVYDKNGKQLSIYYADKNKFYSSGFTYCAADWAKNIISSKPSKAAVTMAKSLLAYGGAAQKYLNDYNPDYPANPKNYMASEMEALVPDSALDMVVPQKAKNLGFDRATLQLSADTQIRLYFNKAITATVDGETATVNKSGSTWLITIDNINSRQLDHMYEIMITGKGGSATIKYSALSWSNKQMADNNEKSMPTAKGLYLYNRAAKVYIK